MKILVTGATGFVGSHLVRALQGMGHIVFATGREGEVPISGVHPLGYDLGDVLTRSLRGVAAVFHQAANNDTQSEDRDEIDRANYEAPVGLFRRAHDAGCRNFVYASTAAVYGNQPTPWVEGATWTRPLTLYARSKLKFEGFAAGFADRHRCSVVGLRYCNVYGPGEAHKGSRASMIHQIGRQIIDQSRPRLFADGSQSRDWVYVRDVVRANLRACGRGFRDAADPHLVCNVSSGESTSFNEIVRLLSREIRGGSVEPVYIENPFRGTYQERTGSDVTLARERLGWRPRSRIRRGIRDMVRHWRDDPGWHATAF